MFEIKLNLVSVAVGIVIGASAMFFIQPKSDFEVFMDAQQKRSIGECKGDRECIREDQADNAAWYVRQTNKKRCP